MKSILYVGATLMIGASIYGFVDYKKTRHDKEFRNLYDEKEVKEPVKTITDVVITKEPVAKEKIIEVKDEPVKKEEAIKNNLPVKGIKKNTKKEKKFNYKLFSRAPLDRRYLDKELNTEELRKSEPVKIVKTDSPEEKKEQ
jgi:hypothetical protein